MVWSRSIWSTCIWIVVNDVNLTSCLWCIKWDTAEGAQELNDDNVKHVLIMTIWSWTLFHTIYRKWCAWLVNVCITKWIEHRPIKLIDIHIMDWLRNWNNTYFAAMCRRFAAMDANVWLHILHFKSTFHWVAENETKENQTKTTFKTILFDKLKNKIFIRMKKNNFQMNKNQNIE